MSCLTVCVCAYNASQYLRETLSSLEKQNVDFEYLLIDDGSLDDTPQIMAELKETSAHKVRYKRMNENRGTAYCRNLALHHVDTDLMMFFDSDDIAGDGLIERLYSEINKDEKCIAVSCYSKYIDEQGKECVGGQKLGPTSKDEFIYKAENGKLIFMLPIALFYTKIALAVGGYRQDGFPNGKIRYQDLSEDLDLWSRMSDRYIYGEYMITIPEVMYYYRKTQSSLSNGREKQRVMDFKMAYIKANLRRRRQGLSDYSYLEFEKKLEKKDVKRIQRGSDAGFYYRQGAFFVVQKKYIRSMLYMLRSFFTCPKVILQKLKANFG